MEKVIPVLRRSAIAESNGEPMAVICCEQSEQLDVEPAEYFVAVISAKSGVRLLRARRRGGYTGPGPHRPTGNRDVGALLSIIETCHRPRIPLRGHLPAVLPGLADAKIKALTALTPAA